jgi:transposase
MLAEPVNAPFQTENPSGGSECERVPCEVNLPPRALAGKDINMQPIYRIVAAIDVHKASLVVIVIDESAPSEVIAERTFLNSRSGARQLSEWLRGHKVTAVVMESTAQYWWPVWVELEADFQLYLAQARSNKGAHGRKTDRGDACRLARRWASGDLRLSFVPEQAQRSWRRLARTWKSLGEQIVEIRNEIEAVLEEGQIKLAVVVTDLLGVSGRRVLAALAAGSDNASELADLFNKGVRASRERRIDALDGRLAESHRLVLRQHLVRIDLLERQRAELEAELTRQLAPWREQVRRLAQVPGINVIAAHHLIAEIGARAEAFPSAPQLASWAGVCPGREESAGESRSDRSPKGNRFVRGLICQIAHAASRTRGSFWEGLYQSLVRRMPANKALWAVAHRILKLIWKLLAEGIEYSERGPRRLDSTRLAKRMRALRLEFQRHGYQITFSPPLAPSAG